MAEQVTQRLIGPKEEVDGNTPLAEAPEDVNSETTTANRCLGVSAGVEKMVGKVFFFFSPL